MCTSPPPEASAPPALRTGLVALALLEQLLQRRAQAAGPGQISFLANPSYAKYLAQTRASAVILSPAAAKDCRTDMLVLDNPYLGYAKLSRLFDPLVNQASRGVHATAVISPEATLGKGVEKAKALAQDVVSDVATVKPAAVAGNIPPPGSIVEGPPPGGACRRVVERSEMKLPLF